MAVVKFTSVTNGGKLKVDKGIEWVRLNLIVEWQDLANVAGVALRRFSVVAENDTKYFERSDKDSGKKTVGPFKLSGSQTEAKEYSVSWESENCPLNFTKISDAKLGFKDDEGSDYNATVEIDQVEKQDFSSTPTEPTVPGTDDPPPPPPPPECGPGPWSDPSSAPPTCGSPPTGISSSDGLQISKTGQDEITLNLKNYPNKLVTLKVTHNNSSSWTQSFGFNVPNCSDISPDTGGLPYSKSSYYSSSLSGDNIFYLYNLDGGDHNYIFTHGSTPGPAPWRQLRELQCSISTDSEGNPVTTCVCVDAGIEYFSPWPYCTANMGVAISKNGGDRVQWAYDDGSGNGWGDQFLTVEVVSIRNAIGATGSICTSALKGNVWVPDSTQEGAIGNCIGDYRDHGDKVRFRIPSLKQSKTSFTDPICHSDFRNIAGAIKPTDSLGTLSGEYSVLHLFDGTFNVTTDLILGNGISVTPQNLSDSYHSTYEAADPSADTNLGTTSRRYYSVTFTDGTEVVGAGAGNINISVGQGVTADSLNTPISVFKKERTGPNSLDVWFYASHKETIQFTDTAIHVFDDDLDVTDENLSDLSSASISIVPQQVTDPGNETVGYETLNESNKKHYLITFLDDTIVGTDGENINISLIQSKTASGDVIPVYVSKKERVDDKNLRVWFTAYFADKPAGLERDNAFMREWDIFRNIDVNYSGNVFVRNWYLTKEV